MDPEAYARQLRKPEGAEALATTARMELLNALFYYHAESQLPEQGELKLLEIGPGNGAHALPWLKANPSLHYHALDYSPDALAICQVTLKDREDQTSFTAGDARNPVLYEPDSCDVILSVNTIYFMDDLEALFRLWLESLKPGGRLLLGFRPAAVMRQFPFSAHGFVLYGEAEVRNALISDGFKAVDEICFKDSPREVDGSEVPVSGCFWVYQK